MSDRPWYQIASVVYELNHFILTVDYYSKWPGIRPEIRISKKLSLLQVVKSLKSMCSRYGITYELVSNSGPQYANKDFKDFAKDIWIHAHYVESTVSQIKRTGREHCTNCQTDPQKNKDPYKALMDYRNAEIQGLI